MVFSRLVMLLWLCACYGVCWLCGAASSSSSSSSPPVRNCPWPQSKPPFLTTLLSQCHLSSGHPNSFLLEMDGNLFERALRSKAGNIYAAVLFYASQCPFSQDAYSTFEVLGSMYPQIDHLTVEQSSAMPSLFSRYGIHSLPAVLIVNQNSRTLFHGSKDLDSLIKFYKKTTGHEPVQYIAVDQCGSLGSRGKSVVLSGIGLSAKEILTRDPYLSFSLLFLCLRVTIFLFPKVLFHSKTLVASFCPQLNLEIFGETGQILGRIFHMIDFRRVWTKIRLCKNRKFHRGARNARAFASSLASVSLSETSTSKL